VAPAEGGIELVLQHFPPRVFERGETLVLNAYRQGAAGPDEPAMIYIVEGLVRGAWNRSAIAPGSRATAVVAGDGRWLGADAFKYGENLFRYEALTPTSASVIPLSWMREKAPRDVLLDALRTVSLDWCTRVSVLSLGSESLYRRTLLLLYDMSRLHPRPEIEVRQKEVAEMLGVARQTLQPVLKRLERKGLVELGYGEISISDPDGLMLALRTRGSTPDETPLPDNIQP
jgi:CRP/FNR family cyclic AMP-dependent transcriptional regulator